jgi:hypothetical protein
MDTQRLQVHVKDYVAKLSHPTPQMAETMKERAERVQYFQGWTAERLQEMSAEELLEYLSRLWAMLIWGNKAYVIDKLIADNGLAVVRNELARLIWSEGAIEQRWDRFRKSIKGVGPAMMSELLAHVHPDRYLLWNRRAYVGLEYLGAQGLPRYNYQVTGAKYASLCVIGGEIVAALAHAGIGNANFLDADYFIWEELQVQENLSQIGKSTSSEKMAIEVEKADPVTAQFIHDEVKEKLADIGQWLGFVTKTEIKVADGSVVDTVWESTIGNMGRVIYVFEVQTKGSIDSLLMNLLKALNNPAVQGIVAVTDAGQIEKIRKHAAGVAVLREKLRYWDYTEVLTTHEALSQVNESINKLGLVPQGLLG